jgi:hypothetical protein
VRELAKEVEHVIARSAETSAFEPMDACDAYDAWRDQARGELVDRGFVAAELVPVPTQRPSPCPEHPAGG